MGVEPQAINPDRAVSLGASLKRVTLVPRDKIRIEDWLEANAKANKLAKDFINELRELTDPEERKDALRHYGTRLGSGTPEEDFFWLMSSPHFLTMPYRHFCIGTHSEFRREILTGVARAQTEHFLSDRLARVRFAQSVVWMNRGIANKGLVTFEVQRLSGKQTYETGMHYGRSAFPRDRTGKPTPEYWWDARLAILLRQVCDSDSELDGWKANEVDEQFAGWAKDWLRALEGGLVRPGRTFGWRVDRRLDVAPVRAMPPATIPKQPFDGCKYPPMDDYLKKVLFSY